MTKNIFSLRIKQKRYFEKSYANNQSIKKSFNQQSACHPTNSNEITIPVSFKGK